MRSRSAIGLAWDTPYSSSAVAYLFEQSWLADENTRSEPRVRMNWMHPAPAIVLNVFGLPR